MNVNCKNNHLHFIYNETLWLIIKTDIEIEIKLKIKK